MPRIVIGSDEHNLIVEPETNVNGPAASRVPERNDANAYAAYWQARSGFFTSASPADRSRERSGEQLRSRVDA